jgi:hypothetical protein
MANLYTIKYHTGEGDITDTFCTLDDAQKRAEERASCTRRNISIHAVGGEQVCIRYWYGTKYDQARDNQDAPIIFGKEGFYADWSDA